MPKMSTSQVIGYLTTLVSHLDGWAPRLQKRGMDVAMARERVQRSLDALLTDDTEQESLKAKLRNLTERVEQDIDVGYMEGSSVLDMMAGALGKTTAEAQVLLELRASIRRDRRRKPETGTAVEPGSEPPPPSA